MTLGMGVLVLVGYIALTLIFVDGQETNRLRDRAEQ